LSFLTGGQPDVDHIWSKHVAAYELNMLLCFDYIYSASLINNGLPLSCT